MSEIPQLQEPGWLLARTDQKLAEMRDNLTADRLAGFKAVLIPLFDPAPGVAQDPEELARWDRTCDNCGKFTPENQPFFVGHSTPRIMHGKKVILEFGACRDCIGLPA